MAIHVEKHDQRTEVTLTRSLLILGFLGPVVWARAELHQLPLVLVPPFILALLWHEWRMRELGLSWESPKEAFARFATGPVDGCAWSRGHDEVSCIALSLGRREIYVYRDEAMARIPFEDVRSFDVDRSGALIRTGNLLHPEFRVRTANRQTAEQWAAICRRFREGAP